MVKHNPVTTEEKVARATYEREASRRRRSKWTPEQWADYLRKSRAYYQNNKAECNRRSHEWYKRNREKCRETARRWDRANPDKVKAKSLRRKYGITLGHYQEMLAKAEHKCAGCLKKKHLHVDHCHQSGKVRGLLCRECNSALGMVSESADTMLRLISYLRAANAAQ